MARFRKPSFFVPVMIAFLFGVTGMYVLNPPAVSAQRTSLASLEAAINSLTARLTVVEEGIFDADIEAAGNITAGGDLAAGGGRGGLPSGQRLGRLNAFRDFRRCLLDLRGAEAEKRTGDPFLFRFWGCRFPAGAPPCRALTPTLPAAAPIGPFRPFAPTAEAGRSFSFVFFCIGAVIEQTSFRGVAG